MFLKDSIPGGAGAAGAAAGAGAGGTWADETVEINKKETVFKVKTILSHTIQRDVWNHPATWSPVVPITVFFF